MGGVIVWEISVSASVPLRGGPVVCVGISQAERGGELVVLVVWNQIHCFKGNSLHLHFSHLADALIHSN